MSSEVLQFLSVIMRINQSPYISDKKAAVAAFVQWWNKRDRK